jgi:hypothetical protein
MANDIPRNRPPPGTVVRRNVQAASEPSPPPPAPAAAPTDSFEKPPPAKVSIASTLPQRESTAQVFNARTLQAPLRREVAPKASTDELSARASDTQAPEAARQEAREQLGALAEKGDAAAIRELTHLARTIAGESGRSAIAHQLLRAPTSALGSDAYEVLADNANLDGDERLLTQLTERVAAGDPHAIDGIATAVERSPYPARLGAVLAAPPQGALDADAYDALGRAAAHGSPEALRRLRDDAGARQPGAVQGLETLLLHGISPSHRDDAFLALGTAAQTNPEALDSLRELHHNRSAGRADGVNAYFNAVARLTDPARTASEVRHLQERGELVDFIEAAAGGPPEQLAGSPLRDALMEAALGPPPDDAVRLALLDGLTRADTLIHKPVMDFAESDIQAASAAALQEITRRAGTDPDMERLLNLLQVSHRMQNDSGFANRIDPARLQEELRTLLEKPSMQEAMLELRASSDVFGIGADLAQRIQDPAYQDRLRLMPPGQRQQTLEADLGQLARADPVRAQQLAATLAAEQIARDPVGALAELPADQRQEAIEQLASELEIDPRPLADWINTVVEAKKEGHPLPGIDTLLTTNSPEELDRRLSALGQTGSALSRISAAITLVSLADSIHTGDVMGILEGTADLTAATGDIASIFMRSSQFLDTTSKLTGVIGGAAGAVLDGFEAYNEFQRGDYVGGTSQALTAAGTALFTASPWAGELMPVAAFGGLLLMASGETLNAFAEEDIETFARMNGLMRP